MHGWIAVGAWFALMSLFALLAMRSDKRRSEQGRRRIREADLLLLALIGGSPGLALGMGAFRHKTRKRPFLAKFAVVVLAQGILAALFVLNL